MTNTKATVKSCGCAQCRRGKGNEAGAFIMKYEERAARHAAKAVLRKDRESEAATTTHRGTYTD